MTAKIVIETHSGKTITEEIEDPDPTKVPELIRQIESQGEKIHTVLVQKLTA